MARSPEDKLFAKDRDAIAKAIDPVAFDPASVRGDRPYDFKQHIYGRRSYARRTATLAIQVLDDRGWRPPEGTK